MQNGTVFNMQPFMWHGWRQAGVVVFSWANFPQNPFCESILFHAKEIKQTEEKKQMNADHVSDCEKFKIQV